MKLEQLERPLKIKCLLLLEAVNGFIAIYTAV
jgi:hypothetical protein